MSVKPFFFCAFLCCFNVSFGQQQKPEVLKITTTEKYVSANIGEKHPIEMYLKWEQFSEDHLGIYAVKGWYQYENKKIRIPVTGIFDGDLTLFHFTATEKQNDILSFNLEGDNLWDKLELLKRRTDFEEKFVFTEQNGFSGIWSKGSTTLKVSVYDDLHIYKAQEFLQIPKNDGVYSLNLYDLNLYVTGFGMAGYKKDKGEIRILLDYEFGSRDNIQGMCGAGIEKGYITLHFDSSLNLISTEDNRIESCLNNIYYEAENGNENVLHVVTEGDQKQKWRVDIANAELIKLTP